MNTFKVRQGVVESESVLNYCSKISKTIFQNVILVFLTAVKKYWIVERQFICREAVFSTHLVYENKFHGWNFCFHYPKKTIKKWFGFYYNNKDNHNRIYKIEKTPMEIHRGHFRFIFRIKPLALSDSSMN